MRGGARGCLGRRYDSRTTSTCFAPDPPESDRCDEVNHVRVLLAGTEAGAVASRRHRGSSPLDERSRGRCCLGLSLTRRALGKQASAFRWNVHDLLASRRTAASLPALLAQAPQMSGSQRHQQDRRRWELILAEYLPAGPLDQPAHEAGASITALTRVTVPGIGGVALAMLSLGRRRPAPPANLTHISVRRAYFRSHPSLERRSDGDPVGTSTASACQEFLSLAWDRAVARR